MTCRYDTGDRDDAPNQSQRTEMHHTIKRATKAVTTRARTGSAIFSPKLQANISRARSLVGAKSCRDPLGSQISYKIKTHAQTSRR
mmetsp:Transcript_16122/g.32463  ORF Transcript_16122/g.32463 Transcript_16122/m.32463 type:complete len:86 (+) Transcript_16122:2609-2866(+)